MRKRSSLPVEAYLRIIDPLLEHVLPLPFEIRIDCSARSHQSFPCGHFGGVRIKIGDQRTKPFNLILRAYNRLVRTVKVIAAGTLTKKITLSGVLATAGAKAAIEAAGGSVA